MLNQNKTYLFALDKVETMTYSWYNIEKYKNNKIRYGIVSEETDVEKKKTNPYVVNYFDIEFSPGCYSYDDINEYIKNIVTLNNHLPDAITIEFALTKFKCLLKVQGGFVFDLKNSEFGNLIRVESKEYGYIK